MMNYVTSISYQSFLPLSNVEKYREWLSDNNGSSWKAKLKTDIDEAVRAADSYEDFLELIRAKVMK